MREVWAVIAEFPWYGVSTNGRVRNSQGHIIKPSLTDHYGYIQYHFSVDNKVYSRMAHRLVAATFIDPNIDGFVIDHLDNDPANNHVSNLEIVTTKVNCQRTYDRGRRVPPRMKAVRIVETGDEFRSVSDCARALNRDHSAVSYALNHGTRVARYHIKEA